MLTLEGGRRSRGRGASGVCRPGARAVLAARPWVCFSWLSWKVEFFERCLEQKCFILLDASTSDCTV